MARLLLGILIITFSCKPTENKLIGKYTYSLNFEVNGRLDLYPNKRFVFNARQGLAGFGTKGTWNIETNQLILNSDTIPKDRSIFEFKDEVKAGKLRIRLFINNGDNENRDLSTLPFARVRVTRGQQSFEFKPDDSGVVEIDNGHIDSLIVATIGFIPLEEKLNVYPQNNLDIILTEEMGNTRFDNEVFIIKGKRLIENNKNSEQKIRYRKN